MEIPNRYVPINGSLSADNMPLETSAASVSVTVYCGISIVLWMDDGFYFSDNFVVRNGDVLVVARMDVS